MSSGAAAAWLLDHPAVPWAGETPAGGTARPRLSRRERLEAAVQMLAAVGVLLEHDLWPAPAALRHPTLERTPSGVRVRLSGTPRPLEAVCRRLGGGRAAFERLCRHAAGRAWELAGLGDPPPGEEGAVTGVGPWLLALLDRLDRPLPPVTARALWWCRLPPLPEPVPGEVRYLACAAPEVAGRLAAELAARVRSRGGAAWRIEAGRDDDTAPRPAAGRGGVLAIHGVAGEADLTAAARLAASGAAVAVVGRFPPGWSPPPAVPVPGVRVSVLTAADGTGTGPFDPASPAARDALTWRVAWRGEPPPPPRGGGPAARLLAIAPEGVPEPVLLGLPEVGPATLAGLERAGVAVRDGGRWRPLLPARLGRDPLNRLLAALEPPGSPGRLLREVLAGGDPEPLTAWVRERIAALDPGPVRGLLERCVPEDLPEPVRVAHAEACLLELDPAGALRALAGAGSREGRMVAAWAAAVDREPGWRPPVPAPDEIEVSPLAAAAVALEGWGRAVRSGRWAAEKLEAAFRAAVGRLEGVARRWAELEEAWVARRERLRDRVWRRRVVGSHPLLRRRWLHLRALAERDAGRLRAARRALREALSEGPPPGWAALLELDLGAVELMAGRTAAAELRHLRALRLFEAAGFRHRTEVARFNLAVAALDRLEVERAASRLAGLSGDDPYVVAERARLELARGDEAAARRLRARLEVPPGDAVLAGAAALLDGVLALLDGDRAAARGLLEEGGAEGEVWLALLDAVEGRRPRAVAGDGWGVALAARWVAEGGPPPGLGPAGLGLPEAWALALLVRLRAAPVPAPPLAAAGARRLAAAGLDGWARLLRGAADVEAVVAPLAEVAEAGLEVLAEGDRLGPLLAALGVTGLEVRPLAGGPPLLRVGEGEPTAEAVRGVAVVTALGAAPPEGPLWRLLLQLIAAAVPGGSVQGDGDDLGLVGSSEALRRLREDLRLLAPGRLAVLLLGETGVGKEVAARALHRLSGRRGRFVPVNVAALPEQLVEAELFGALRGAYTGAAGDRQGLIRAAHRGTLFLDEIGELEPRLQAKLLRFLESGEVRPVGADAPEQVDVRVLAATHRDLERMVDEGSFRRDLYYRLATAVVRIPPLRERREDIPELRAAFEAGAVAAGLPAPSGWSPAAEAALLAHPWPGNVRELRHVVEVALTRARGGTVRPEHLGLRAPSAAVPPRPRRWDEAIARLRRELIAEALEAAGGNRSEAARRLGISRQTLLYHLRTLGLDGG